MRCVLTLLLLGPAAAFQLGAAARRSCRTNGIIMETESAETAQCALISLSAEDPLRLAQVLKKAWMEGGVKRGLVGTVLIGEAGVQIAAQGKTERLESFANWIESSSMLVTGTEMMGIDACPALGPLTAKFPLADAEAWSGAKPGSFSGDLAEKLKSISVESQRGTTHSNDEGLF